ncbi:F-box protein At3g07870-like [Cornus florida]|uniref:F-box protein At3g07870-like n=1 Tax=Cornus florida TaxID=4283 RepID=UPI00289CAB9E|nr:F-box protein At3g07870-like [Cornus florida]
MSDFLPSDVLIDVLARLPVKTIVQCTCVCKSWYSLLTSPSFITTHLNRSCLAKTNNNDNHLLLIQNRSGDDGDRVRYSLMRYWQARCETEMFCDYAELELPLKSERDPYLRVIGCCNGLVCLSEDVFNYMEELHLWNPSIRKTMALHPLRVTYQSHVVRIVHLLNGTSGSFEVPPEVDVFSLSTGTWRNISHLGLQYTIREKAPQAYLNRAAHWLAYDRERRRDFFFLIVSFHMGDEVFG